MSSSELKFLVDVGVGRRVEEYLKRKGFDIKAVVDLDPRMPDEKIISLAALEARMVVTMDKDFGELVTLGTPFTFKLSFPAAPPPPRSFRTAAMKSPPPGARALTSIGPDPVSCWGKSQHPD